MYPAQTNSHHIDEAHGRFIQSGLRFLLGMVGAPPFFGVEIPTYAGRQIPTRTHRASVARDAPTLIELDRSDFFLRHETEPADFWQRQTHESAQTS